MRRRMRRCWRVTVIDARHSGEGRNPVTLLLINEFAQDEIVSSTVFLGHFIAR